MDMLIKGVNKIINHHHDDVRVYEVESLEDAFLVGKRSLQVMLFSHDGKRVLW